MYARRAIFSYLAPKNYYTIDSANRNEAMGIKLGGLYIGLDTEQVWTSDHVIVYSARGLNTTTPFYH